MNVANARCFLGDVGNQTAHFMVKFVRRHGVSPPVSRKRDVMRHPLQLAMTPDIKVVPDGITNGASSCSRSVPTE